MLGEQIGSLTASTINKPLSADGALPKFEVTATGGGTLAGAMPTPESDQKRFLKIPVNIFKPEVEGKLTFEPV